MCIIPRNAAQHGYHNFSFVITARSSTDPGLASQQPYLLTHNTLENVRIASQCWRICSLQSNYPKTVKPYRAM